VPTWALHFHFTDSCTSTIHGQLPRRAVGTIFSWDDKRVLFQTSTAVHSEQTLPTQSRLEHTFGTQLMIGALTSGCLLVLHSDLLLCLTFLPGSLVSLNVGARPCLTPTLLLLVDWDMWSDWNMDPGFLDGYTAGITHLQGFAASPIIPSLGAET